MKTLPGSDNYEFETIGTDKFPFLGYNSSNDKTSVNPQFSVRGSKNVYLKSAKTFGNRPGLKTRGANDTTTAGVTSSWEWNNSLGKCLPLRVANNKLQIESSILGTPIWYELFLTSTLIDPAVSLTRFVFDSWYDSVEKKDRLVMVRGDANLLNWSGGMTLVASGTINTITKKSSTTTWNQDGFASQVSGEKVLIINGIEYTYTGGENTQTLTGVSPDASGISDSQVAIQSVLIIANGSGDSISDTGFKCDMIRVIGNQLCVGSYTSRLIYISDKADFDNFTVPTPPLAGSPELLTLDNTARGIAVRQGNIWISAGTKDWYEITFSNITVGSTLERQTNVSKKNTAELAAAYAHEFIDNWGDDIIYLAQDQQVRDIGTFIGVLNGQKFPSLSLAVMDELAEETFTGGHLRIIGEPKLGNILYMTAPTTGRDYMFTLLEEANNVGGISSERLWHPPQIRNISRFAVISGVTYGHSNANPMIYQVWDTNQWHDDSPVISVQNNFNTNLVSYYSLDGNSNDSVGSNNGTDTDIIYSTANGKINQGAGFNGTTSKVILPLVSTAVDNVSLTSWVKLDNLSQNTYIFYNGNGNSSGYGFYISDGFGNAGHNLCGLIGGVSFGNTGVAFASTGVWYHIAMVRTNGSWQLYLNSVPAGSTFTNTPNVPDTGGRIGDTSFSGAIDECGFWNRALSATEITQLYNNGLGISYLPVAQPLKYVSVLAMAYRSFGRRQGKWSFNKLFILGYMSQGTTLDANVLYDYQGATGKQSPSISSNDSPAKQFLAQSAPSIGDSSLGDNPLGDGLNLSFDDQDLLPKFYKICNLTAEPCYEFGVEIFSQNLDDRWEVMCLGVNPWLATQQGVELQR